MGGPRRSRHRERGASLLEALIGFLVVAVGLLTTAQWQNRLRQAADLARQQAEALRIAQQELETLRAYVSRDHHNTIPSFADIASTAPQTLDAAAGANTVYTLDRRVQAGTPPTLKVLAVGVHWADLRGSPRSLRLDSLLSDQAPALALALARAPAGRDASPVLGRHAAIPREALALGDGRSVLKPVSDGTDAWVFDDRSGRIVARCDGIAAARTTPLLGAADLAACTTTDAVLLSGRVRFALAQPPALPDAGTARETPLPMSVTLVNGSPGHAQPPVCLGEAVKLVSTGPAGAIRVQAVGATATPAGQGLVGWTELGDRHWRYHCAVTLAPGAASGSGPSAAQWSGRLQFAPIGWTLGTVAGARRLCRYSADTDGSGQVDRPAENADSPSGVEGTLAEQNFLVVDGTQPCPTRPAATVAGGALPWSDANPATVPHQP